MTSSQIQHDSLEKKELKQVLYLQNINILRTQGGSQFELFIPDFQVQAGQFIAVTGESGCGKSTLLDVLALILKPSDEGDFLFYPSSSSSNHLIDSQKDINKLWKNNAEDELAQLRRKNLGYVPQNGGLLPFLNVRDNLFLSPRLNNQTAFKERIDKQAKELGIEQLFERKPQSLSGGQRQRVAILRAMAHQPDLILADEPTAAVDSARAHSIVDAFKKLAYSQNTAIIMVTHDRSLVAQNCDQHYSFTVDSSSEECINSVFRRIDK